MNNRIPVFYRSEIVALDASRTSPVNQPPPELDILPRWVPPAVFAALTAVAAFGIGCMVQANSIASLLHESLAVSPWLSGAVHERPLR